MTLARRYGTPRCLFGPAEAFEGFDEAPRIDAVEAVEPWIDDAVGRR